MGLGWVQPAGGGVDTVNGVAPIGGDVTITGDDIPYTPTYATAATTGNTSTTLGGQVKWAETNVGPASWVWGEPTLEAAAPEAGGAHTINRATLWLTPLGGAPISPVVGRRVVVADPGSINVFGTGKVLLVGSVAGPLLDGELVVSGLSVLNTSVDPAAEDFLVTSFAGRAVRLDAVASLGNGGTVGPSFGPALFNVLLAPGGAPSTGIDIDGVVVSALFSDALVLAPAGGGYNAISVGAGATIANQLGVSGAGMISLDPTDALINLDVAATLPGGGPLPTDIIGTNFFNCQVTGPGSLFSASGLGAGDIRVFSGSHQNGPRSNWIGDAIFNSSGAPPDALLDHVGQGGVPLIVPFDNSQNGGVGGTLRTLTLTSSAARHSLLLGTANIASVNAGGTYTGGDGDYPATQASTSGVGTGVEFTVTLTAGTITAVVSIDSLGSGYVAADTITLLVAGPAETVAAVLDVDDVAWAMRTDGPVDDLTGVVGWTVDFERGAGGAGSSVFGYLGRRKAGAGSWVEVSGTRSIPKDLIGTPLGASGNARIDDIGVGDEWTVFFVNDAVGSTQTLFTIIEPVVEGQP